MKRTYQDHDDEDEDDDDLLFDHHHAHHQTADTMMFEEDEPISAMYIDQVPLLHGPTSKNANASTAHQGPKFEVQRIVPVRSEKLLLDNVCYFKQQALITLLYGHVTQGVKVPGLFDQDHQRL
jgi:hypothetical protein